MEAWRIRDPYALHHFVAHLRAWHDAVPGAPSIDASSALYSLVLDDAFRAARIDDTGNSTAVLTDLDTALATALGADDTAAVVRCAVVAVAAGSPGARSASGVLVRSETTFRARVVEYVSAGLALPRATWRWPEPQAEFSGHAPQSAQQTGRPQ